MPEEREVTQQRAYGEGVHDPVGLLVQFNFTSLLMDATQEATYEVNLL